MGIIEILRYIIALYIEQCSNIVHLWHPTPVLLPRKSHGWRSLVGYSPWGHQESDTTERRYCHLSLPCIGEGNGNPPQRSCLENPRDRGAWWAAVYGVSQSRTRLKQLSSSSSTYKGFPGGSVVKNLPVMQETQVLSLGWKEPLEKGTKLFTRLDTEQAEFG